MKKRLLFVCLVVLLVMVSLFLGVVVASSGIIGFDGNGGTDGGCSNNIMQGSVFSTPVACNVTSISAYLNGTSAHVLLAIYNHTGYGLVGSTGSQAVTLSASRSWYNFSLSLLLVPGDYILMAFGEGGLNNCSVGFDAGVADQGHYQASLSYPTIPSTLVPSHTGARKCSIYVNYTISDPVNTPVPTASPTPVAVAGEINNFFAFVVFYMVVLLFLSFVSRNVLLNVLFGMFGFVIVGLTLVNGVDWGIPFHPWLQLLIGFMSVIVILVSVRGRD